jgi:hypothetical protein
MGAVTACGPDLGKANFQRTTVSARPGSDGQVSTGPITDPAVSLAALRVVDPCPLVYKTGLVDLAAPGKHHLVRPRQVFERGEGRG